MVGGSRAGSGGAPKRWGQASTPLGHPVTTEVGFHSWVCPIWGKGLGVRLDEDCYGPQAPPQHGAQREGRRIAALEQSEPATRRVAESSAPRGAGSAGRKGGRGVRWPVAEGRAGRESPQRRRRRGGKGERRPGARKAWRCRHKTRVVTESEPLASTKRIISERLRRRAKRLDCRPKTSVGVAKWPFGLDETHMFIYPCDSRSLCEGG